MIKFDGSILDELKFCFIPVLLLCVAVYGWITLYVVPHDEMRYQVIDCMGGDASQEAYRLCFEELRTSRASPS